MLRIQRESNGAVTFFLSGQIEREDIPELHRLFGLEASGQEIALDLRDVVLIDRDAMQFLARCQAEKIRLDHCPGYVRQWMEAETAGKSG